MLLSDFDFDLPGECIALRPAVPRDAARLLLVDPHDGGLGDRTVRDLPDLLRPGDVLVVNDTRVIPAALSGTRTRGDASARISVNLIDRIDGATWSVFARPLRRLAEGDVIDFAGNGNDDRLQASVVERTGEGRALLRFGLSGPDLDRMIAEIGQMPLPPYIAGKRAADEADNSDYQTLFARNSGAVAAPTAGLHFTDGLVQRLEDRGIERVDVTLHVGAGTFLPVKTDTVDDHRMHAEFGEISPQAAERLNDIRAKGGRIVSVGTTSLRLLESAVRPDGVIEPFCGETDIFIKPGHRFRAVDVLMTNFHLPRSTLFMLVCAFSGTQTMKTAYAHATNAGYRFYSYGDASLLFPETPAA